MKRILAISFLLSCAVTLNLSAQNKPAVKTSIKTNSQSLLSRGKAVYNQYCMSCHQADGGGVPNLNPPLIKTSYVLGDKTRLINIVLKGMSIGVVIDDEEYTNPMPPLSFLSDQQIADVLTYVRSNFQNKASAITTAEVKAVRGKK